MLNPDLWQKAHHSLLHVSRMRHTSINDPDFNTVTVLFPLTRAFNNISSQQQHNVKSDKNSSPSTQEGLLRVVPATFPGKQEHLTVWERSSIRFLLQHRWAAITSHVPPSADRQTDVHSQYIWEMKETCHWKLTETKLHRNFLKLNIHVFLSASKTQIIMWMKDRLRGTRLPHIISCEARCSTIIGHLHCKYV